jgi:hypothetical protein
MNRYRESKIETALGGTDFSLCGFSVGFWPVALEANPTQNPIQKHTN